MFNSHLDGYIKLVYFAEGLKKELRHCSLSDGRVESVAEHCWRLSLMVMGIEKITNIKFDMLKALKIAIVHDIAEIITSDIPLYKTDGNTQAVEEKYNNELKAMEKIREMVGETLGEELIELWLEHEHQTSIESKIVKALDKLEAQIQHNQSDINTWTKWEADHLFTGKLESLCNFDEILNELCIYVVDEGKEKIKDFVPKSELAI